MKRTSGISMVLLFCFMLLFSLFPEKTTAKSTDEMAASTVLITCGDLNGAVGMGTGFVVGNSDHVVTNHHVIDCDEGPVNIILERGKIIPAQVIWSSDVKDLAVLQTQSQLDRPAVSFTKSNDVKVADNVYVMGFPGAANDDRVVDPSSLTTVKVAKGIVSAKVKSKKGVALYQTDAPINPGNSGGPMFSENGEVIGINVAASLVAAEIIDENGQHVDRIRLGDNIGWSIQADELLVELDQLGIKYQVEGRHVPSNSGGDGGGGTSIFIFIAIGLGGLAVLLAFLAFILSLTKRGRVIVKEVSRRVIPNSNQAKNQTAPVIKPVVVPPTHDSNGQNALTKPYLIGVTGPYSGQKFQIGATITIGRSAVGSQIIIQSNIVSSTHCTISFDPINKVFFVTDLESTNGTFLGSGQRLAPHVKTTLQSGQRFYLGNQDISFEVRLENA